MSVGAGAGAAAGARAAAIQAVRASGVVVRMEPLEFLRVLQLQAEPLVVQAEGGFFSTAYHYLSSYKGLAFFTTSPTQLQLPSGAEIVQAKKIWIPG